MATFRYAIITGLAGCYMPDSNSGPYIGSTRRELMDLLRSEIEAMGFPASTIRQAKIRDRVWPIVKRHGSSSAHISIQHEGLEILFQCLTEDEANAMEAENA